MSQTIAILGIDGSGKSSIATELQQIAEQEGATVVVMRCPQYHLTHGELPFRQLSEALDDLNAAADEWGNYELKGVGLFLQMTLFGPVQNYLQQSHLPQWQVSERHSVIDTLVYSNFYVRMIRQNPDPTIWLPKLQEKLGPKLQLIEDWVREENRRLGRSIDLWNLPLYVRDLCESPVPVLMPELDRQFQTFLPDVAIFVDLPPQLALKRISSRKEQMELHEQLTVLNQLRTGYSNLLEQLQETTEMRLVMVSSDQGDSNAMAKEIYKQII